MGTLLKKLLSVSLVSRPTATACIRMKLFKRSFTVSRQLFNDFMEPEEVAEDSTGAQSSVTSDDACTSEPDENDVEDKEEEEVEECDSDDAAIDNTPDTVRTPSNVLRKRRRKR